MTDQREHRAKLININVAELTFSILKGQASDSKKHIRVCVGGELRGEEEREMEP